MSVRIISETVGLPRFRRRGYRPRRIAPGTSCYGRWVYRVGLRSGSYGHLDLTDRHCRYRQGGGLCPATQSGFSGKTAELRMCNGIEMSFFLGELRAKSFCSSLFQGKAWIHPAIPGGVQRFELLRFDEKTWIHPAIPGGVQPMHILLSLLKSWIHPAIPGGVQRSGLSAGGPGSRTWVSWPREVDKDY
jgi:hypothetical protein